MESVRQTKFKKASRVLAVLVAVLLLATIFSWGIASNWGDITYTKISMVGANGEVMGGIIAMPAGVDDDHPAPVVVSSHGSGSQSIHETAWAIEYARRGYVIILQDSNGDGEAGGESAANPKASADDVMRAYVDYAKSQRWCDGRVVIQGLSMGGYRVTEAVAAGLEVDCAVSMVMHGYDGEYGVSEDSHRPTDPNNSNHTNFLCLFADADHYFADERARGKKNTDIDIAQAYLKDPTAEAGVIYGSFEDKTAFMSKAVRGIHPVLYLSTEAHEVLFDFVEKAVPTNTSVSITDHVFPLFFTLQAICILFFVLSLGQFAYFLTLTPTFYPVLHTTIAPAMTITKKQRVFNCAIELLIPFLLFFLVVPFVSKRMRWLKPVFRSTYINPIIFWLLSTAIVSCIILVIRKKKQAKERTLTAADFGTGPVDCVQKFNKKQCLYGAIVGITTTLIAFVWMDMVVKTTGLSYTLSAWAAFTRITPHRLVRAIPYVIVILFIVTIINIGIATTRRFPATGNETRDTIRDVAFNVFMSIFPLCFILLEYFGYGYLRGDGMSLIPITWHPCDNMASCMTFPVMMGSSAGISTYLYKKTGNIYAGTITATLILGLFTVANAILAA